MQSIPNVLKKILTKKFRGMNTVDYFSTLKVLLVFIV